MLKASSCNAKVETPDTLAAGRGDAACRRHPLHGEAVADGALLQQKPLTPAWGASAPQLHHFNIWLLWLLQPQDDFRSAAKALTEAVAQREDDNLELTFATAADTDFLAYVYAKVPPDPIAVDLLRMVIKQASLTLATTRCTTSAYLRMAQHWCIRHDSLPRGRAPQWKTPEGIEKHLSAQHTLKFLDHVKVIPADEP